MHTKFERDSSPGASAVAVLQKEKTVVHGEFNLPNFLHCKLVAGVVKDTPRMSVVSASHQTDGKLGRTLFSLCISCCKKMALKI